MDDVGDFDPNLDLDLCVADRLLDLREPTLVLDLDLCVADRDLDLRSPERLLDLREPNLPARDLDLGDFIYYLLFIYKNLTLNDVQSLVRFTL